MRNAYRVSVASVLGMLVGLVIAAPARADDASQGSPYRIVMSMSAAGESWQAYRINTQTGEVCWPTSTNGAWTWTKAAEPEKLPPSDYDLQVRSFGTGNNVFDSIFRIDRKTGRSWKLESSNWLPIAEPK